MLTPAPVADDATTQNVDGRFLELVLRDADLLAAEFDALVAAECLDPPVNRWGPVTDADPPRGGSARPATDPARASLPRPPAPGVGERVRQRSPPVRQPTRNEQEGR